jgi:hypothetical protein
MTVVATLAILALGWLFGGSNIADVAVFKLISGALASLFLGLAGVLFRGREQPPSGQN